ncbi:MAG TPA: homoserine O-succinyltransferase [Steroidobacteraceae bacterium]|nr:homoserine O-succinyltransferase [Steroidobacteraceae bacterium]
MNLASKLSDPPARHGIETVLPAEQGVWQSPDRLPLHHGGSLEQPCIGWRLDGAAQAGVVVALGGISAHRRVFDTHAPGEGWWSALVGPGRALDSSRLRVLGMDYLGASGESTGPVPGGQFPSLSSYDQAEALRGLMDHLRIERLTAIVGASYGGMVALAFAERYPERVEQLLVLSAADRSHPMATAWRSVQRRIVRFALSVGRPAEGLALARALAMATYRSPQEFAARFGFGPSAGESGFEFPVEQYLIARGCDYAARYLPESFLCLSESIDLHAVDASRISVLTTLVAVREDQLVPLGDMQALAGRLAHGRLHEISSPFGHDSFLKEAQQLAPIFRCLYGES